MGSLAAKLAELKLRWKTVAKGHCGYGKRYKHWLLKLPVNGDSGAFLKVLRNRFSA